MGKAHKGKFLHAAFYRKPFLALLTWQMKNTRKHACTHTAVPACENIFKGRQIAEETYALKGSRNAKTHDFMGRFACNILSLEENAALFRGVVACDAVEDCCLSCAVRADQPHDRILLNRKAEPVNGLKAAKNFGDILNSEQIHDRFRHNAFSNKCRALSSFPLPQLKKKTLALLLFANHF